MDKHKERLHLEASDLRTRAIHYGVPEHTVEGLVAYIVYHIPPGSFVQAVLENDLMGAFLRADNINREHLGEIAEFLYHHAPIACVGNKENVQEWIKKRICHIPTEVK